MKIIDNFVSDIFFNSFKNKILDRDFAWYHQNSKVSDNDNQQQFTHVFYQNNSLHTEKVNFELIKPILYTLNVKTLLRVKLNLQIKEDKVKPTLFHTDNKIKDSTTAIFYLNTNNGKTLFENNKEVKSVANRVVIFPSYLKHAGTTHTDTKYRIVLNINFIKKENK